MNTRCPSDLALEALLLAPRAERSSGHVATCEACKARLAQMELEGQEFRRFVYPATVDRIEEAARRKPWWRTWRALALPVPALAAAAAAILFVVPTDQPAPGYVGFKGDDLALTVFARSGNAEAQVIADGGAVNPSAALRFRIRAASPCQLVVLSIDAAGAVSRLDGGGSAGVPVGSGQHDLPGGAELDGTTGPERIFAVCTPGSIDPEALQRQLREQAGTGPDAIRALRALSGLPQGARQSTTLIEKRP